MKKLKPLKIDVNSLPVRDPLIVALIRGATKAGIHVDQRKKADKKACRKPVQEDE